MRVAAAIYTSPSQYQTIKALFGELLPDCRLYHIIEDGMIGDVTRAGHPTDSVLKRLELYCRAAELTGAQVILLICTSVGGSVGKIKPGLAVPIIRIDEAMMRLAVGIGARVGMLATLQSTLAPSTAHLSDIARQQDRQVQVFERVALGAHEALLSGDDEAHDRLVLEAAKELADKVDVLVLAQASMSRMERQIQDAVGKRVLSSPRLGVLAVRNFFERADLEKPQS